MFCTSYLKVRRTSSLNPDKIRSGSSKFGRMLIEATEKDRTESNNYRGSFASIYPIGKESEAGMVASLASRKRLGSHFAWYGLSTRPFYLVRRTGAPTSAAQWTGNKHSGICGAELEC